MGVEVDVRGNAPDISSGASRWRVLARRPSRAKDSEVAGAAPSVETPRAESGPLRGAVRSYVAAVSVVGGVVLAYLVLTRSAAEIRTAPGAFWVLSVLVLAGELFPVRIYRREEVEEVTLSTAFSFAILMAWGAGAAVVATVIASAIADAVHRKPAWKLSFNVGQCSIGTDAAGLVYFGLGGSHLMGPADLFPFFLAAIVRFILNNMITGAGVGMAEERPLLSYLKGDLLFQAATAGMLMALSPLVVLATQRSLLFAPLMASPILAVYLATSISVRNSQLVERLEESLADLHEANRLKDEFIAMVSHELRTPLTSIQGYIKTLLRPEVRWSEEDSLSFLGTADRQSDRLRYLIEQLLAVVGADTHRQPLVLEPAFLPDILREATGELMDVKQSHHFEVRIGEGVGFVLTEPRKLHQDPVESDRERRQVLPSRISDHRGRGTRR